MLTVYKASAGSGKTFNLVYEYVKVLLGVKARNSADGAYRLNSAKYCGVRQPERHHGILAITFTNAATKEMKSRVVEALVNLASPASEHPYIARLTKAFGCTADELREAAGLAKTELLNDYGNFHISTIDSFSQSVLRAFSRELNRQVDYDIELDVESSIRESVSDMLQEIKIPAEDSDEVRNLRKWIERYATSKRESGSSYNFFNTDGGLLAGLTGNLKNALDETYNNYASELDAYLENPATINRFYDSLKKLEESVLRPLKAAASSLLAAARDYPERERLFKVYKRALQVMKGSDVDTGIALVRDADSVEDKAFVNAKCMKEHSLSLGELAGPVAASRDFCILLRDNYMLLKLCRTLSASAEVMEFFGHARRSQLDFLKENNTMLIADTNRLLKEIIDGAEAPFIYERLGELIHTILIDEFQDTSQLQWDNLAPLVRNSLSEGFDDLIIGDVKQSIYRFRNTDSRLLGSIVESDETLGEIRRRGTEEEDCTNRRSAWPIVKTNNSIFSILPGLVDCRLGVGKEYAATAYADVVQTPAAALAGLSGYVDIRFMRYDEDVADAVLDSLVDDIRRQHDEGGYDWRDILVLVRWNREGKTVVDRLKASGIPVLSAESLLLNSSPAVRTVISLMKLVRTYYDPASVAVDMDNPSYSQSRITMLNTRFNFYVARGCNPVDALDKALRHDISDDLRDAILRIRAMNPANIVALIDAIIKTQLSEEQRTDEFAYLAALQDIAIRHADSSDTSLGRFLADYDANIDKWTIKPGANQDAVEVMTVHKSKGLERACVHIPLCSWELKDKSKSLWLDTSGLVAWLDRHAPGTDWEALTPPIMWFDGLTPDCAAASQMSPFCETLREEFMLDVLDALNTTYVAFTRAARELIVHAELPRPAKTGDPEKNLPVGSLLLRAVESPDSQSDEARLVSLGGHFDHETLRYVYGAPTVKYPTAEERRKAEGKAMQEEKNTIHAGLYAVSLDNADTQKLFSIDDVFSCRESGPDGERSRIPVSEAAVEGIHFHEIMSRIRVAADLGNAVENYCKAKGLDSARFLEPLRRAFGDSDDKTLIAGWFDPDNEIYSEAEIFDCERRRIYRPDRVVVRPDGTAVVIDYKFPVPGEDLSRSRAGYVRQVARYKRLLKLLGYKKVSGYLWYPRENRIVEVKS